MLEIGLPEFVGLEARRWDSALALAHDYCRTDLIPSIGLIAGRAGKATEAQLFGRQCVAADSSPIRDDAIFLVASITKPIVAMGTMLLVERGQVALSDRVFEYLPEFGGTGRYGITVRHLLTHTSGLPDMLPNNGELRASHAPYSKFYEGVCRLKPGFPPGRKVQYQSMGFLVLAELIGRVSGMTCAQFLRKELFDPLGMRHTSLGAPEHWFAGPSPTVERIAEIRVLEKSDGPADWDWNSRYWRSFGAPWGGLLTTPADLSRFASFMLAQGRADGRALLSRAVVDAATCNQLVAMPSMPENERRCEPWGLGWRLNWVGHSDTFGDLLGPRTYGHWGATGTLFWIDPDRDRFAIFLSTQPKDQSASLLIRLSNAIAAAFS